MAPKLASPYHLLLQREELLTSRFHTTLALLEFRGSGLVREARTNIADVVSVRDGVPI